MRIAEWLRLWAGLFVLGIADPDPRQDDLPLEEDPPLDVDPGDEAAPDADLAPDDDDPVVLKAARDKATKEAADFKAEAERHRIDAETLRRSMPPPPVGQTEEGRRREAEERELADPKIDANRKWQIEANRTLRETRQKTDATLAQATDMSDKANFDLACASNKRFAAVKTEVEEELKKARSVGQNVPREALAYFILGKKVATAQEKKPATPAQPGRQPGPGVRSDVRVTGKQTEHQKRAKRLENVNI